MGTQNFFVLTPAQAVAVMALNGWPEIETKPVDTVNPGVGINLNPDADGYDAGDVVPLSGNSVLTVRIVNDPAYINGVPDVVAYLADKPFASLETETIFLPPEPI